MIRTLPALVAVAFVVTPLFTLFPAPARAKPDADCRIADTAIEISKSLRKLSMKQEVPCKLQSRPQVEKYLRDTLTEKIPPGRIADEGKVYEILGLVPPGYDYLNSLIKLYTEQLGGYYDPETHSYVMADWLPEAMQMSIAVHELTHALQDQHFHLEDFIDETNDPSDKLMARSALVEGDATLVMFEFTRQASGQPPLMDEKSVSAVMMQNIAGAMMSASLSNAPPALQAMLIFPYVSGLRFVHAIAKERGVRGIDDAFRSPPASSEEILHPELYLRKKKSFTIPALPPPPTDAPQVSGKAPFEDTLGEFAISALLGTYIPAPDSSRAASGWGGDKLGYFPPADGRGAVLLWRTAWDTPKDAKEFFSLLRAAYEKRFNAKASGEDTIRFDRTPLGTFVIRLDKQTVDLAAF